jgi:hypothetical protein
VTSTLLDQLLLVAVLLLGAGFAFYYILRRRLHARLASLREAVGESPAYADDRAHNLLALARSEAATLKRGGADVHVAEGAIADAERALRRGEYDDAHHSARRAHELLLAQRASGSPLLLVPAPSRSMPNSPPGSDPASRPNSPTPAPGAAVSGDGSAAPPRLAKNRAESRFQISLLQEEIERSSKEVGGASGVADARTGSADAQAAYDRADYTEALRLALRARRALGTHIESLPAPLTRIPPSPTPSPSASASTPSGTEPCATCGRPLKSTDRFCRSCGTAKAPTACASCGTALEVGDRFCAGCGASVT